MRLFKNKVVVLLISSCMAMLLLFFFWIYRERILMPFRESTCLNFQRDDMEHISIRSWGNLTSIDNAVIRDSEKIEEIIDYLNSLELVEAELPRMLRNGRTANADSILIYIGESINHNPGDYVVFYADYMIFTYHGHKFFGRYTYYVRKPGFFRRASTSNVYQFLHELISEYENR